MELHQVKYFLAVCETLNFTRAAEHCNVSQPALTKAVKKLEDEFGGPLFRRERNQTHLSDLGRLMQPLLTQTYTSALAAKEQASKFGRMDKAPLRLGVMCSIGPRQLLGFFAALRKEVPQLELSLLEASGSELITGMIDGDLDLAIMGMPDLPERFVTHPLFEERYMVAFAPGHRFESLNAIPYRELEGEDYLTRVKCEFSDHMDVTEEKPSVNVNIVYASEREDWIQSLIAAGLGCAVMPEYLPSIQGIETRPLVSPEMSRKVELVTIAGRRYSPAAKAFMDCCLGFDWKATIMAAAVIR